MKKKIEQKHFIEQSYRKIDRFLTFLIESPISTITSSNSCFQMGSTYQHLSVKTPMHICGENAPIPHMDEGMSLQRAEPFNNSNLNYEGQKAAIGILLLFI